NAINVSAKLLCGTFAGALLYWALGSGFMLGAGGGWIGTSGFFGGGAGADLAFTAMTVFYAAFACAAAAILSGAVAERIRFVPYLMIIGVFAAFLFPILGRWASPGGWLG